jgi:hypothetical protein
MVSLGERLDSRSWQNGELTTTWVLAGTDNDAAAVALLNSSLPATAINPLDNSTLIRERTFGLRPIFVNDNGTGAWEATVRYVKPDRQRQEPPEIDSVRITGSTKGGMKHAIMSLATVAAYPAGVAATTDNGKLIGVTADSVEGVDVPEPALHFQVVKVFDPDGLPNLSTLKSLSGSVNDASFTVTDTVTGLSITLAAGECRFEGVDFGGSRVDGGVEFSYEFSGSDNLTGIDVGAITGIAKDGWDYLWCKNKREVVAGEMTQKPTKAYVERVSKRASFGGLSL